MGNLRIFTIIAWIALPTVTQTTLSPALKVAGAIILLAGILAFGQSGRASAGTAVTTVGAVLLAIGVAVLVVGLITSTRSI